MSSVLDKLVECPGCGEKVLPIPKMFGVMICPKCSTITDGGKYSMERGN